MKADLKNDFLYPELSNKIIGCAFSVFNSVGAGHLEKVYQKSLAVALKQAELGFKEEVTCSVFYGGMKVGTGRADFLVEDKILVELKRGHTFNPGDFNQLKSYLASMKLELGLMFRFTSEGVIHKRVVHMQTIEKIA